MEHQPLGIRKSVLAVAFLALALSYVIGLWALHTADVKTHRLALEARAIAVQVAAQQEATRHLRAEQLALLDAAATESCRSRHRLTLVLRDLIERSIGQEESDRFPNLTPGQQAALNLAKTRSIASLTQFLRDLRTADCTHVNLVRRK